MLHSPFFHIYLYVLPALPVHGNGGAGAYQLSGECGVHHEIYDSPLQRHTGRQTHTCIHNGKFNVANEPDKL